MPDPSQAKHANTIVIGRDVKSRNNYELVIRLGKDSVLRVTMAPQEHKVVRELMARAKVESLKKKG